MKERASAALLCVMCVSMSLCVYCWGLRWTSITPWLAYFPAAAAQKMQTMCRTERINHLQKWKSAGLPPPLVPFHYVFCALHLRFVRAARIPPDERWKMRMNTIFLAAAACARGLVSLSKTTCRLSRPKRLQSVVFGFAWFAIIIWDCGINEKQSSS